MENFNELFEQAAKIADHRSKVFNQLIDKTVNEILPRFCEACRGYDISEVYITTMNKANEYQTAHLSECGEKTYTLAIDVVENTFSDTKEHWDNHGRVFYGKDGFWIPFNTKNQQVTTYGCDWLRTGIVEFTKDINSRLADYNKKYQQKNEVAETLLS
jgi:hypothetical protein